MKALPLFPVTTVGSWPRPPRVIDAQRDLRHGRIDSREFDRIADDAVVELLALQDRLGCDIVTDAELRRDTFRVTRALAVYPAGRVFLNPDCGFGTFSNRPMNGPETAAAKLQVMVEAARALRQAAARAPGPGQVSGVAHA